MELSIAQKIAVWALPVLFAITVHEFAHGWMAWRLGDGTAKFLGRVSLNPLKHIDPIGTIIVPAILMFLGGFMFGWAKPVPVNFSSLRNPKRDMALVALAGPLSNLIMAILWSAVFSLSYHSGFIQTTGLSSDIALLLKLMGEAGVLINVMLMLFNLLPIPPLDGSRIASSFMNNKLAYQYNLLERYGFVILLGLMFLGMFERFLSPWVYFVGTQIIQLFI
jgi:Zn-dependent protease